QAESVASSLRYESKMCSGRDVSGLMSHSGRGHQELEEDSPTESHLNPTMRRWSLQYFATLRWSDMSEVRIVLIGCSWDHRQRLKSSARRVMLPRFQIYSPRQLF